MKDDAKDKKKIIIAVVAGITAIMVLFCVLLIGLTGFFIYSWNTAEKTTISENQGIFVSEKVRIAEAVIEKVKKQNKIIVLDVEASQEVEISKSFHNMKIFEKSKNVTFYGKGQYVLDLRNFDKNDIEIDDENKTMTIYIDKPVLEDVYLDEEKTAFKKTEKGIFAFGEYKLTPEEYNDMEKVAKDEIRKSVSASEYRESAKEAAKENMESLVEKTAGGEYTVTVKIKGE